MFLEGIHCNLPACIPGKVGRYVVAFLIGEEGAVTTKCSGQDLMEI
jgi:hypothetical protein